MKVIVREGDKVHYDRLLFKVVWSVADPPSVGQPVILKRTLTYPVDHPLKRVHLFDYPAGTRYLGHADTDSRERRAK